MTYNYFDLILKNWLYAQTFYIKHNVCQNAALNKKINNFCVYVCVFFNQNWQL